ncbi:MAG: hypothetical protein HYY32_03440, partial [Chloroflexi bacterium]|nr:hypothetical protein [Chloroflexota bacterium]
LFYGKALPPMPPRILFGQDDIDTDYWVKQVQQNQQYDPAKARQLLAAAGYASGFSGIKLYVTPLPGMEYVDKLAQIVQSYWKAIGVNAEVLPLDLANLVAWRREPVDGFVGHATFGVTNLSPAISNFEFIYGSRGAAPLTARNTGKEITSFTPDMDKAIYGAITEIDPAKRKALIAQAIKLGMDTYTVTTFGQVPAMMGVGPKVKFELKQPLEVAYAPQWADMALHK